MRPSFEVHADVLRMAKTKEQREAIKWFHARRVFFDSGSCSDGLELARQSEHPDARLLVSLFPGSPPVVREEVYDAFMARQDDPRCLCWAGMFTTLDEKQKLYHRSAMGGCAMSQALVFGYRETVDRLEMLERGVAQGEPEALALRASLFWSGEEGQENKERAKQLWLQAALLGLPEAQFHFAEKCCARDFVSRFQWFGRAAMQERKFVRPFLEAVDSAAVQSGRALYEIGAAVAVIRKQECWPKFHQTRKLAGERPFALYTRCNEEAKRAVLCWLWFSRTTNVVKDIRLLIADLIWDKRAAWSERPAAAVMPPK